jgi:hypothetical protein
MIDFDTSQVDREIAALEERNVALDAKLVKPDGRFDGDVISAQGAIAKQLLLLQQQRSDLLSGIEIKKPKPPEAVAAAAPLRDPFRIAPVGAIRKRAEVSAPLEGALLQEICSLFDKFEAADAIAHLEDEFRGYMGRAVDERMDRSARYSQANYIAMLMVLTRIDIESKATREFYRNRRVELEDRIKELEARPIALSWAGVYAADVQYKRGTFVTYDGSLWHCNKDLRGVLPGKDENWTLAVKRGRDGRER